MIIIYQDRLGTNMGEIQPKSGVFRRALFDLKRDPHELRNIYNETKAD
jgi:hypothetical protein